MLGISTTDDAENAVTLDHFAVLTDRLHAAPDFHTLLLSRSRLWDKTPKLCVPDSAYKGWEQVFSDSLLTAEND